MQETTENTALRKALKNAIENYIAQNRNKLSEKLLVDLETLNSELNSDVSVILVSGRLLSWIDDVKREITEKTKPGDTDTPSPLKWIVSVVASTKVISADYYPVEMVEKLERLKGFPEIQARTIQMLEEYKKGLECDDKKAQIGVIQSKVFFITEKEKLFVDVIAGLEKIGVSDEGVSVTAVITRLTKFRDALPKTDKSQTKLSKNDNNSAGSSDTQSSPSGERSSFSSEETSSNSRPVTPTSFPTIDPLAEKDAAELVVKEEAERKAAEEREIARVAEEARVKLEQERAEAKVAADAKAAAELAAKREVERIAAQKATAEFQEKYGPSFFARISKEVATLGEKLSKQKKAKQKRALVNELENKIQAKKNKIEEITDEYKDAELAKAQQLRNDIKLTRERMKDAPEKDVNGVVSFLIERFEKSRTENARNIAKLQAELEGLQTQQLHVLGEMQGMIQALRVQQHALEEEIAAQEELIANTMFVITGFNQASGRKKDEIINPLTEHLNDQRRHLVSKHTFKARVIAEFEKQYPKLEALQQGELVQKTAKKWWDYIPFVRSIEKVQQAYDKRYREVKILFEYSSKVENISAALHDFSRPNIDSVTTFNDTELRLHNGLHLAAGEESYKPIETKPILDLFTAYDTFKRNCEDLPSQRAGLDKLIFAKYDVECRLDAIMSVQSADVSESLTLAPK